MNTNASTVKISLKKCDLSPCLATHAIAQSASKKLTASFPLAIP
jgi:hypothetical protein